MKSAVVLNLSLALIFGFVAVLPAAAQRTNDPEVQLLLNYRVGYGGYTYPTYIPHVLYADGTVVKEPNVPLDALKFNALTKQQATNWGTYEKRAGRIHITWSDGKKSDYKLTDSQRAIGGSAGDKMDGTFRSISGSGNLAFGGNAAVVASSSITFASDGRFTMENVAGSSSSNVSAYSKADTAGRYALSGYTLTLKFNNGKERRAFFCFFPAKNTGEKTVLA